MVFIWCYNNITTLVIHAGNGYHLYQGLTVILANLRELGFTIGGLKRDWEFQQQIDQLERIFNAKFVMANETHPVQLSFEKTAYKMQYHSSGNNKTLTRLYLEREYLSIAVGLINDRVHIQLWRSVIPEWRHRRISSLTSLFGRGSVRHQQWLGYFKRTSWVQCLGGSINQM